MAREDGLDMGAEPRSLPAWVYLLAVQAVLAVIGLTVLAATALLQAYNDAASEQRPAQVVASPQISPTPAPTSAPAPVSAGLGPDAHQACQSRGEQCAEALLAVINADRAAQHVAPLALSPLESAGTSTCPGATGHARHMAGEGHISHDQFAADICVSYTAAGENVGEASGYGSMWKDIVAMHSGMMAEPWSPGCTDNHHCNLLNPQYQQVGIGFAWAGDTLYLSEDFTGNG